jgi:hypothetical protein
MPYRMHAAALLVASLVVAGCSSEPEPEPEPIATAIAAPTPTPTPTPTPSPVELGPLAPLTGAALTAQDGDLVLGRTVLAVKVENTSLARPQSGLELADVVYEELVEGGVTRFIALFQSQVPDVVGPVRSARLVDVEILPSYAGVFAISGARDQVLRALSSAGVPFMADGTGFYRERSRRAPHNLFATGESLYARAEKIAAAKPAEAAWLFESDVPEGFVDCDGNLVCADASRDMSFAMSRQSSTGWVYDEPAGVYRRLQDGHPFLVTGEGRVGAANVVILEMLVGPGACCDSNGSPLVATTVTGEGRAVILRDGNWYEALWRKDSRSSAMEFVRKNGMPFPLKPGSTWVHLAPSQNVPGAP